MGFWIKTGLEGGQDRLRGLSLERVIEVRGEGSADQACSSGDGKE